MASLPDLAPRPFSVADYQRMVDTGILASDERVELLEGVIVRMSPQNDPHAFAIEELNDSLVRQVAGRYRVRPQLPLVLGKFSQPEPDLAIVPRKGRGGRGEGHPKAALLVVEVAGEDSLPKDRLTKGRIYAQAGIPEYWILDLKGRVLEVYRTPDRRTGVYRHKTVLAIGDVARPTAVAGVAVSVADLFA
jgi:Uma2 family endonuclease